MSKKLKEEKEAKRKKKKEEKIKGKTNWQKKERKNK